MKISHCHNPSNSTLCERCALRLCFDNHGGREAIWEKRSERTKHTPPCNPIELGEECVSAEIRKKNK